MKKSVVVDTNINMSKFNSNVNIALHKICSVPLLEHVILKLKEESVKIYVAGDNSIYEYLAGREDVSFINSISDAEEIQSIIPVNSFSLFGEEERLCETREDFYLLSRLLQKQIIKKVAYGGVNVISPENTYISPFATVGKDSVIYPGVHIEGNTEIGENTVIYPDTTIVNSIIGDNATVRSSVILESRVGNNTNVGPFAYIRPGSNVGDFVKVGDFVEIKNSEVGNGTKISHLTYVGDSKVGENVNFGCGTVTVNYDGINKFGTVIGDGAFIGCNTNLVAPVTVGDSAFIAAGSTITDTVPENGFAIARARQTNKENWVKPKDRK